MKNTIWIITAVILMALTGYSVVIMDDDFESYETGHYPGTPYPPADAVSRANAIDGSSTIGDGNALEFWDTSTSAYALLERNLCDNEAGEYQALHISFDLYNTQLGDSGNFYFCIGSYNTATNGGTDWTMSDQTNRYMALLFDCTPGENSLTVQDGANTLDTTLTYNLNVANHIDVYINDGETGFVFCPGGTLPANTFAVYLDGTLLGKYCMIASPLSIGESSGLGRIAFMTERTPLINMQIDNLFVETVSTEPDPTLFVYEDFSGYVTGRVPTTYPPATCVGRANAYDGSGTIGNGNAVEIWDNSLSARAGLEYNLCTDESGEHGNLHLSFDLYNIMPSALLPSGGTNDFAIGIGSYSTSTGTSYALRNPSDRYFSMYFSCDAAGADTNALVLANNSNGTLDTMTYDLSANNHYDVYINDSETQSISYIGGTLGTNSMALYVDGTLRGVYPLNGMAIGEENGLGRVSFFSNAGVLSDLLIDNILVETIQTTAMTLSAANGSLTASANNLRDWPMATNILQTRTNLVTGTWSNLYTVTGVTATNWTLPFDSTQGFYRIQTTY